MSVIAADMSLYIYLDDVAVFGTKGFKGSMTVRALLLVIFKIKVFGNHRKCCDCCTTMTFVTPLLASGF